MNAEETEHEIMHPL